MHSNGNIHDNGTGFEPILLMLLMLVIVIYIAAVIISNRRYKNGHYTVPSFGFLALSVQPLQS